MTTALEYAVEQDDPAFRLLRRIVAWTALGYGAAGVALMALSFALQFGLLPNPGGISFNTTISGMVVPALRMVVDGGLAVGGGLLLRRDAQSRSAAILTLRVAALGAIAGAVVGAGGTLNATARFGWPMRLEWIGRALIFGAVPSVFFMLLTLPPLARRMVRA